MLKDTFSKRHTDIENNYYLDYSDRPFLKFYIGLGITHVYKEFLYHIDKLKINKNISLNLNTKEIKSNYKVYKK